MTHEDIRRSLEILDNVLAEYDDNADSWHTFPLANEDSLHQENANFIPNGTDEDIEDNLLRESLSKTESDPITSRNEISLDSSQRRLSSSPDVATSQLSDFDSSHDVEQQPRKYSPPPVPKRSPATRLSNNDSPFFFPNDILTDQLSSTDASSLVSSKASKTKLRNPLSTRDVDSTNTTADASENLKTSLQRLISGGSAKSISNQNLLITNSENSDSQCSTNGVLIQDDDVFVRNSNSVFCVVCGCVLEDRSSLFDQNMEGNKKQSPWVSSRRVMYENINDGKTEEVATKKGQPMSPGLCRKLRYRQADASQQSQTLNTERDDVRLQDAKAPNVDDKQQVVLKNVSAEDWSGKNGEDQSNSSSFQQKLASFQQDIKKSPPTIQKVNKAQSFHQKLVSFQQESANKSPATIRKVTKSPSFHHRLANFQHDNNLLPQTVAKLQCDNSSSSIHSSKEDKNLPVTTCPTPDSTKLQNEKLSRIETGRNMFSLENKANHTQPSIEERLKILDKRFAEVRYLLSTNQIRGLDKPPPSFKPLPPPDQKKNLPNRRNKTENNEAPNSRTVPPKNDSRTEVNDSLGSDSTNRSENSMTDTTNSPPNQYSGTPNQYSGTPNLGLNKIAADSSRGLAKEDNLCDNCAQYKSKAAVINNISDVSKMLPTDTLNKPQLGLSYTMEDDLCPGVKEILTSTPKNDASNLCPEKMTGNSLSTFSQSISSLGYGSSQSDLDLNISSQDCDKIPVVSLKSQTLPIGMKLAPSPFYSSAVHPKFDEKGKECGKRNGNALKEFKEEEQMRSSSAPPLKHLGWSRKKDRWGMSRKEKKENKKANKNDDSLSLNSTASLDDGVILRKLEPLDGSTEILRQEDRRKGPLVDVPTEEKGKRKSVLKSIFHRRKD